MYVSNTARYLGDSTVTAPPQFRGHAGTPQHCADLWRAAKCYHPQVTFADFQRKFPKCARTLACGDNRMPSGSVLTIDCPTPSPRALGNAYWDTIPACQDPPTGMLIDCWNAAVAKGLNGLGQNQATLTRLSTAYQRLTRPDRLTGLGLIQAKPPYLPRPTPILPKPPYLPRPKGTLRGWVPKPGGGMRWVSLGDTTDISIDPLSLFSDAGTPAPSGGTIVDAQGNIIPAPAWVVPSDIPPPISTITTPSPIPSILQNLQPTLPVVTAQTLLAAAALPNAPAVVKQAAAQLPATSWFSQSTAGIPNYLILGGGLFLMVVLASAGGRRR